MGVNQLKEKLEEQQKVYASLKAGDTSLAAYKEFQNGEWGTDDANHTNRLRLAYYLLYWKIEDEDTILYLFHEELKDRERNSFQGIGNTIRILTCLLRKYNGDHRYDGLFKRAKNANFDCACGYDPEETMDDDLGNNTLLDCIYLCREMDYKDTMGDLVDEWKEDMAGSTGRNTSDRSALMGFNTFLGREGENEELYQEQMTEILSAKECQAKDIISGYRDLIRCYLRVGNYEKASQYCRVVIETTDYQQVRTRRLFGDILECCLEVAAHDPSQASDLWRWAKGELQNKPGICRYGNLYTKGISAAKAAADPYEEELEREYLEWRSKTRIH